MKTQYTLTLEQLEKLNAAHGGPKAVLLEGDTARMCDWLYQDGGWCGIRRNPETGLFNKRDAMAALGY